MTQRRDTISQRAALRFRAAFLCLGAAWATWACDDGRAARGERQELATLIRTIDGLRDAPNAKKAGHLEGLRQLPCTTSCALRDACITAYDAHVEALRQMELVRRANSSAPPPTASGVPAAEPKAAVLTRLDTLRQQLRAASLGVAACTEAEFEQRKWLELGTDP